LQRDWAAIKKFDHRAAPLTVEVAEGNPMDYAGTRELVRLRHELRRLMVDRTAEAAVVARATLARIEALIASDAEEAATIGPELARWQVSLSLAP
jgi:hypothetical protein